METYSKLVYSVPRKYKMSTADCDDVHQAVFSALVTNITKIRDAKTLPAWLITTAHRESWRVGRAKSRMLNTDTDFVSVSDPHEETLAELEEKQLVRRGLEALGGRCKDLLMLLFGHAGETAYDKIASSLGIPLGSIGPTRTRCLEKLASILEGLGLKPKRAE